MLPQKLKPPEKHDKSDKSMDLTSTYKQDYNSYPISQVPPCLPCVTRHIPSTKVDTRTTYEGMCSCSFFQDFTSSFILEEDRSKQCVVVISSVYACQQAVQELHRHRLLGIQPCINGSTGISPNSPPLHV